MTEYMVRGRRHGPVSMILLLDNTVLSNSALVGHLELLRRALGNQIGAPLAYQPVQKRMGIVGREMVYDFLWIAHVLPCSSALAALVKLSHPLPEK